MSAQERVRRVAQVCTILRGLTVLAFLTVLVCGLTSILAGGVHIIGRPWPAMIGIAAKPMDVLFTERAPMPGTPGEPGAEAAPSAEPPGDGVAPEGAAKAKPQRQVEIERRVIPRPGAEPQTFFYRSPPDGAVPPPGMMRGPMTERQFAFVGPGHGPWTEHLPPEFVPTSGGWSAYVLAAISIALVLLILFQFERLFAAYADGQIFTEKNANRLGIIGALIAVAGLLPSLALMDAVRARFTGDLLSLGVDLMPNMGLAAMGGFLVLVAYLMREGSMLAQEVEDTVYAWPSS